MKPIVAANWKMNKTPSEARDFVRAWKSQPISNSADIVIFPPSLCLESTVNELAGTRFQAGSQNTYFEKSGAFTGENSPQTVKTLGAQWALIGHSERRTIFHESDEVIAQKVALAYQAGLSVMLCIGETLAERDQGKTNEVLERQLKIGLSRVANDWSQAGSKLVCAIAYEPVWAIGTGRVAEPEQVKEAHEYIQGQLAHAGIVVPILYGGSVKGDNAAALAKLPHVSGFLVGGASLDVSSFLMIVHAYK